MRLLLDRTDLRTPKNAASAFGPAPGAAVPGSASALPPNDASLLLRAPGVAWLSDPKKVRAMSKITFVLQRSLFALTIVQLTEIAYLSHFSRDHQTLFEFPNVFD